MIYPELIKEGSLNEKAVKAIKTQLNTALGIAMDVSNPHFGPTTKQHIINFQKKNLLNPDGVVGALTWERLFSPISASAVTATSLRVRAEQIMFSQLHVREKTGRNDGVEVESYLKSTGLGKGYPWCMAFVFWGFQRSSVELSVPNLVPKTAGVMDCFRRAKKYVVATPAMGDQFIMDFGGGTGHTGVVTAVRNGAVFTIEGNTSADPAFAGEDREGNGVFERSRPISSIKAFLRYV